MEYDFFIAGRYREKRNIMNLVKLLRMRGKSVYCFFESEASKKFIGDTKESTGTSASHFENLPNWWVNPIVREVFDIDMSGLRNAKNVILLLPAGKSAHVEIGIAFGIGKNCILIGNQKEAESLYLVFHEHYDSIESFAKHIR